MQIKNATIYRIANGWTPSVEQIEQALQRFKFTPTAPTQQKSGGFVPPRGIEHGALVESIGGQLVIRLQIETRGVPAQTLKKRTDEIAKLIEEQTGRKPGKKQRKELSEQALLELLPMAFTKTYTTDMWVNLKTRTLVVNETSASKCDDAISAMVKTLDGLVVSHVVTESSPAAIMSAWLHDGKPDFDEFTIDRECELKSTDELRSVVRYGKHPLDIDEIRGHILTGKVCTNLALTWRGRVSFVLNDAMQIKKVKLLDVIFEGHKATSDDAFDADVAIQTGELNILIPELIEAMGGEVLAEEG